MIIGFTGTREGMTPAQKEVVAYILSKFPSISHVVHGDCIGADTDFDTMIAGMGIRRDIYPCNIEAARSHCENRGAIICLPKPLAPLERNQIIVDKAQCLIATPKEFEETVRSGPGQSQSPGKARLPGAFGAHAYGRGSGTWFTIRRGRIANKTIYIVYADGVLKVEN